LSPRELEIVRYFIDDTRGLSFDETLGRLRQPRIDSQEYRRHWP
jgi:hypothetical protein